MDLKHAISAQRTHLKVRLEAANVWFLVMSLSFTSSLKPQLLPHAYVNIKQLMEKLSPLNCCRHANLVQKISNWEQQRHLLLFMVLEFSS